MDFHFPPNIPTYIQTLKKIITKNVSLDNYYEYKSTFFNVYRDKLEDTEQETMLAAMKKTEFNVNFKKEIEKIVTTTGGRKPRRSRRQKRSRRRRRSFKWFR
jgi:hypothetical protein